MQVQFNFFSLSTLIQSHFRNEKCKQSQESIFKPDVNGKKNPTDFHLQRSSHIYKHVRFFEKKKHLPEWEQICKCSEHSTRKSCHLMQSHGKCPDQWSCPWWDSQIPNALSTPTVMNISIRAGKKPCINLWVVLLNNLGKWSLSPFMTYSEL